MKLVFSFLFGLILFSAGLSYGQNSNDGNFEAYAKEQSVLMYKAYESRDVTGYQKLLADFLIKYRQLDSSKKKLYRGFLGGYAYYNLSCAYSLLNNKSKALEYLDSAVKNGYYNYAHMQEDSDLDNIRKEPLFKKIVDPTREIGDYLYILRKAEKYDKEDKREFPAFTYQSPNNTNLVSLRKEYNLDSIAGTGNEVSKMINLLHWVHNTIQHDGNLYKVRNTKSMIAACRKEGKGLNCRGLAIILNECYLSMGFKSRFVTCMPKDSLEIDEDCHVINAVYSNSLKKWLWMDPTNDAYIMDENGNLLSIEEVRERIINNKPLILNPDANWNHKVSKVKDEYLYNYMAKNLYWMDCMTSSEYDAETRERGKKYTYIRLFPPNYFKQKSDRVENAYSDGTTFIKYVTTNPDKFWAKPE